MTASFDRVNLPEPASGSLLHPLDVTEARGYYMIAAFLRLLISPCVFVAMMLMLWVVSNNAVSPVVGPFVGLTVTAYVERRFRADAWAHIPRRRQDAGRDEPIILASTTRAIELVLLLLAIAAFVSSMGVREVPTMVASAALGAMLGLALAEVAILLWERFAPRDHRFAPAPSIVTNMFGAAVLIILIIGMMSLADRLSIEPTAVTLGAAMVVGVMTVWLLLRLVPVRVRCVPAALDLP